MNVRPEHYAFENRIKFIYGDFLVIECETFHPPSARKRKVYFWLDDDDVTELLKELRRTATRHRNGEKRPNMFRTPDGWSSEPPPPPRSLFDFSDIFPED